MKKKFSLKPVAAHLGELLGKNVRLVARPEDAKAAPGEIMLVENIRFFKGEKKNADELAANLAALGDVYVMDAFGAAQAFSHGGRNHQLRTEYGTGHLQAWG